MLQVTRYRLHVTFIFIFILTIIYIPLFGTLAVSDSVQLTQEVYICDQDGICEASQRENETNCSSDCGCDFDGNCEPEREETYNNCSSDCPAPAPPAPGGPGAAIFDTTPPIIFDLLIKKITPDSAIISWKTNEPSLCQIFYGQTLEYEKGSISETTFSLLHSTELPNLLAKTTYHFKIKCKDINENKKETKDQRFTTLEKIILREIPNVINLKAIPSDSQIKLIWQNPLFKEFLAVRIMRSLEFFPGNPKEGELIYEGEKESFLDKGLINGKRYFYTLFTKNKAGNFSSGAIVFSIPQKEIPAKIAELEFPTTTASSLLQKLTLKDFQFFQKEQEISLKKERLTIDPKLPLTISLNKNKAPDVSKILIFLERKKERVSYLMIEDKERAKILTTIFIPKTEEYSITFYLLNEKNELLKKISGKLKIEGLPFLQKLLSTFLSLLIQLLEIMKKMISTLGRR